MSALYPKKWPITLTMHLRSGEKITQHLDEVKWSPERLPSWQELVDKFRMLADPLIGGRRAERAVDIIATLKPNDTLTRLIPLLTRPRPLSAPGRRARQNRRGQRGVRPKVSGSKRSIGRFGGGSIKRDAQDSV